MNQVEQHSISLKEKFSANLLRQEDSAYQMTVMYMTYKTIEANPGITVNQLRWLLSTEFLIKEDAIDGTVASLTSKSVYNCVSRWQPPGKKDTVHLRLRSDVPREFQEWMCATVADHPELSVFVPSIFKNKKGEQ
jgi:hypothetical protein